MTVIIPAFNVADTLRTALGSVPEQSFPQWEAVVVDDGSRDRTAELVAAMGVSETRIRYHQIASNRGASAARNAGLAQGRGEYVIFLDADDWIGKRHIARLVEALHRAPSPRGAYTGYTIVTQDGRSPLSVCPAAPEFLFQYVARACPFAIHACLVKRRLVQEVGGFDESLVVAEDYVLLYQQRQHSSYPRVTDDASFNHG